MNTPFVPFNDNGHRVSSTQPSPVTSAPTASPDKLISYNPATGKAIGEFDVTPLNVIPDMLAQAKVAGKRWAKIGLAARMSIIRNLRGVFYSHRDEIMQLVMTEQGKPAAEALSNEFWSSLELLAYYSQHAEKILAPRRHWSLLTFNRLTQVERHPHGVVLVIGPWNFPIWMSLPSIIAALIAGNAVIYKPSEYAPAVAQLLVRIIHEAGVSQDVLQLAQGRGDVGAALIEATPNKICFTGSVATGRKIAQAAANKLIPVTLELGGKDAAIVLEDADLDRTAQGLIWSALLNAGQVCASVERVYIQRRIFDVLVQKMADVAQQIFSDKATIQDGRQLGPIITPPQLNIIQAQVTEALAQGATAVIGGSQAADQTEQGHFFGPTILTNVTPSMKVASEETFGPVLVAVPFDTDEEAIRLTNSLSYGLVSSVWTRDNARGLAIGRQLECGFIGINDHLISSAMPALPWGGVKHTGYGRTRSVEGLIDMTTAQNTSRELFAMRVMESLVMYPYTAKKLALLKRIIQWRHAPAWMERVKALLSIVLENI